jgi:hypothetical protein
LSFFEPPQPSDDEAWEPPSWTSPPRNEVGRLVVVDRVLGENDGALLLLRGAVVYSTGFELLIEARTRPGEGEPFSHRMFDTRSDEFLRVGVQFDDGRRATNLEEFDWEGEAPDILLQRRHETYWVYPLPPPGPVTVVVEWPAFGIAETRIDVALG